MSMTEQKSRVTMEDIARQLGVSRGTVSLAYTQNGRISPQTRERVLETARAMGFNPNELAQNLAKGRSVSTVAVAVLRLDLGVTTKKVNLIQGLLNERGFRAPLHAFGYSPQEDAEMGQFWADLRQQRPRAIVCDFNGLSKQALEELARFQDEGGLLVGMGGKADLPCDQVRVDDVEAVAETARHLLQLGHRKLGLRLHTGSIKALDTSQGPLAGFARALEEFHVPLWREWVFAGGYYEDGGARMAEEFLKMRERPTGVCIINDVSAQAFVNAVMRAGLRVPEDVSVVGFDDVPAARTCIVPLTTVVHPIENIARRAVEFLSSRMDGSYDGPPRHEIIGGNLIVRQSTAAPPSASV